MISTDLKGLVVLVIEIIKCKSYWTFISIHNQKLRGPLGIFNSHLGFVFFFI